MLLRLGSDVTSLRLLVGLASRCFASTLSLTFENNEGLFKLALCDLNGLRYVGLNLWCRTVLTFLNHAHNKIVDCALFIRVLNLFRIRFIFLQDFGLQVVVRAYQ